MNEEQRGQIEKWLRAGKPDDALRAAEAFLATSEHPREAAIEVARSAARVYRDLISPPVQLFAELAPVQLKGDAGQLVQKALSRLFNLTDEWRKKLWSVHTERLLREVRDWTRGRHFESAAANIARLMALAEEDKRPRRAQLIGSVLATIINNQREALQLIQLLSRRPGDYYMNPDMINILENARQKRFQDIGSMNIDALEREWSSELNSVCIDIQQSLPGNQEMGEPEEAKLRDFGDIFRSILRVPLEEEQPDLYLDATNILVEFVAKEQTATAKVARVEGRVYNTLGMTAKKIVLLTFQDIGRNTFFTKIYANWAGDYKHTDALRPIVEVMGACRTTDFNEFLQSVKGDKRAAASAGAQLSSALGSIGGEQAAEELLGELRRILTKRRIETVDLIEAERMLSGLGGMIKSPRTSPEERHRILDYLKTHIPEDLIQLARAAALQAFTFKPQEQTESQRHFAVRSLVRALWAPDPSTSHHKGEEGRADEYGHRREPMEALIRIAPYDIPGLIAAVDPLTMRYSGAYIAIAEVFSQIKDKGFIPLLERMLQNTAAHEENARGSYQTEYYWDATSGERKPITKNKIIPNLIHAIGVIDAPESKRVLTRYKDMVAAGKAPQLTGESARFLDQFLGNVEAPAAGEEAPRSSGENMLAADPALIDEYMKAIKKRYLLTGKATRRMKKVEALSKLAQLTPIEALDAVFDQLTDKDPMVVSAAISCAAEFAGSDRPKTTRDLAINTCLDHIASRDPAMREGAGKVLREMGPARREVKDKILAFAKTIDRREVKEALAHVLKAATITSITGEFETGSITGNTTDSGTMGSQGRVNTGASGASASVNKLELKRAYMQARKDWIAGGKKGDPPAPPPGLE